MHLKQAQARRESLRGSQHTQDEFLGVSLPGNGPPWARTTVGHTEGIGTNPEQAGLVLLGRKPNSYPDR